MLQNLNPSQTLAMTARGQRVRVVDIAANQRVTHRLTELGITRGVEVCILQDAGSPMLIAVRDTRLALERGIAHAIRVQPEEARA